MFNRVFLLFFLSIFLVNCSKNNNVNKSHNKQLSPLAKKLIGKWWFLSWNPAPEDFWEFKDVIIDSLSNDSVTYRQYTDSVKQSWCYRAGRWYEKDSVIYGTCIPSVRIIKLTDASLIFRYTGQYGMTLDYKWKRAK